MWSKHKITKLVILLLLINKMAAAFNVSPMANVVYQNQPRTIQKDTLKVYSSPFQINGLHLQFEYKVIASAAGNDKTNDRLVNIIAKRLIYVKNHQAILNFSISEEETYLDVHLKDIDGHGYYLDEFPDINYDGWKDLKIRCEICSGATNNYEDIYLFNPRTKKFQHSDLLSGAGIELNEPKKSVSKAYKLGGGENFFQQVKFGKQGKVIYLKAFESKIINRKKGTFKFTYQKYIGGKIVDHKTELFSNGENFWEWTSKFGFD